MRRLFAILSLLMLPLCLSAKEDGDCGSADQIMMHKLDSLADNYINLIAMEPIAMKQQECDFLLSSLSDSVMVSHLAVRLYNHYSKSRLMGDEAVAVYLWDKWFETSLAAFDSEEQYLDAKVFVRFNRKSLLGCQAPSLTLWRPCGAKTVIPRPGHSAILFFFDTDCAKCKLETQVLPAVLKDWNTKADFYAVYVGTDKAKWKKWRKYFRIGNRNLKVIHLWDPQMDSDFVQSYGVLSTPKLFTIKDDGQITGRRLEVENLPQLESSL